MDQYTQGEQQWKNGYAAGFEAGKKAGGWISVKDRLPKPFVPVIVCREDGKVEQGHKDVGNWWKVYGTRTKRVTHWMPLPDAPEGVGKG